MFVENVKSHNITNITIMLIIVVFLLEYIQEK